MKPLVCDIAIVGSGFGGSLTALVARQLGRSVALVERGHHPRFAIGESSTPLANLRLAAIARRWSLTQLEPFTHWGTWRDAHPEIAVGLKRGFSFFAQRPGEPFATDGEIPRHLFVAASPEDRIADTHWYRPDFDHYLAQQAGAAGAEFLDETSIERVETAEDCVRLTGERDGAAIEIRARLLIDATGPRGLGLRHLGGGETTFNGLRPREGLWAHFRDVARFEPWCALPPGEAPAYAMDDAAVHHLFDGGWIWVLRFSNGIVSAGASLDAEFARELRPERGEAAWKELLDRFPSLQQSFAGAQATTPIVHAQGISFRCQRASGLGWVSLPSAASFVDPLLSTGIPLTLTGIDRVGRVLAEDWGTPRLSARLAEAADRSLAEVDFAARLIAPLLARPSDFALFRDLTRLYFAGVGRAERAYREGRGEEAGAFLASDHPSFAPLALAASDRASRATELTEGDRELIADLVDGAETAVQLG